MSGDKLTIEEKLSLLKYNSGSVSHIKINETLCQKCKNKECIFFCPASVYKIEGGETPKVEYENCLECGACKVACKSKAIKWEYPDKGVVYKFS